MPGPLDTAASNFTQATTGLNSAANDYATAKATYDALVTALARMREGDPEAKELRQKIRAATRELRNARNALKAAMAAFTKAMAEFHSQLIQTISK
jgi:CHASE3 domain sensor protein